MEALEIAWKHWKYLIVISAVFATLYVVTVLQDRPPSVSLSDDLQSLQRQKLSRGGRISVPSRTDSEWLDVPPGDENHRHMMGYNSDGELLDKEVDTDDEDEDQVAESVKVKHRVSLSRSELHDEADRQWDNVGQAVDEEAQQKLMEAIENRQQREIVGNDRFVHQLNHGIQRPEEFYERHRDVKLSRRKEKEPTSTSVNRDLNSPTTSYVTEIDMIEKHPQPQNTSNKLITTPTPRLAVANESSVESSRQSGLSGNTGRKVAAASGSKFEKLVKSNVTTTWTANSRYLSAGDAPLHFPHTPRPTQRFPKAAESSTRRVPARKRRRNGTTLSDLLSKPNPPIVVQSSGDFMNRVGFYNDAIRRVRDQILQARGYKVWQDVVKPSELNVIWGNEDDFLDRLAEHQGIRLMILPWISGQGTNASSGVTWNSIDDRSNVLINEYFQWSAAEQLCHWIRTPGFTRGHWDAVYRGECNEELGLAARPSTLETFYLYGKPINSAHYWPNDGRSYPSFFYAQPPSYVFYVNLIEDAVINSVGDVISGDLKIVPYTCSHDNLPTIPEEYMERPVYREVFVITQFWGQSFFHKMLEVMPRVSAYVDFLRDNPGVLIHSPEDRSQVSQMLGWLGIGPERIVTGVVRAKLAYLPQGTPCGFPDARALQLLSRRFRDYLKSPGMPRLRRNRLVYVRRSGLRRFVHGPPIEYVLQTLAEKYRLNYTVFGDSPTPPLADSAAVFAEAVVVVGPHGAGLSNVVFAEPGTGVVEGVCNEPHVNMCYQFAAHVLGLRYHALVSSGGCERVVDVMPESVEDAVDEMLRLMLSKNAPDGSRRQ